MRIVVALQPEVANVVGPLRLHRVAQNPIARRLLPPDSCMGGYRTPARLWTLGPLWPASDTLHHDGHPWATVDTLGPDIAARDHVGRRPEPARAAAWLRRVVRHRTHKPAEINASLTSSDGTEPAVLTWRISDRCEYELSRSKGEQNKRRAMGFWATRCRRKGPTTLATSG
jgi:hypothetical protein